MEFPKMIYLGGEHGAEHRIVADQAEQDAAKEDGFLPVGTALEGKLPGDEKAKLFAQLDAAGVEYKKTWGIDRLRTALEGKPE